jgi:hypothetical protein
MKEEQLKVGTKIKIGEEYAKKYNCTPGEVLELVNGQFEYDNGLYTEIEEAPSVWNKELNEFDSIYHLFGNDLENFMDCEILI